MHFIPQSEFHYISFLQTRQGRDDTGQTFTGAVNPDSNPHLFQAIPGGHQEETFSNAGPLQPPGRSPRPEPPSARGGHESRAAIAADPLQPENTYVPISASGPSGTPQPLTAGVLRSLHEQSLREGMGPDQDITVALPTIGFLATECHPPRNQGLRTGSMWRPDASGAGPARDLRVAIGPSRLDTLFYPPRYVPPKRSGS
jgi:hypothetical protein